MEHNEWTAWIRLWGAIGAAHAARWYGAHHPAIAAVAQELADFEMRRFKNALAALETTRAAREIEREAA